MASLFIPFISDIANVRSDISVSLKKFFNNSNDSSSAWLVDISVKIGRASCRERVYSQEVVGAFKKQIHRYY